MHAIEFFIASVPILIHFYAQKYLEDDRVKTMIELDNDSNVPKINEYDFIVVGGGSAGCVVAGRLSENFNVLLLEAGGEPPPAAEVPYFAIPVALDPDINYFFESVPMTKSAKAAGGVVINHTGKMLGGSGSHNDLIHSRGSPRDYDNWAAITGDESWTYANVLKYFKRTENFIGQKFGNDSDEFYGQGGPITVDTHVSRILPTWLEAGKELGYNPGDPNGFQTESFTPLNKAIRKGHRTSPYSEYIRPYENIRDTLTVIRYANVSEILLDESQRAYGVAYTRHGFPQIAHASKEIILSAGAYSSPLLLMKSGIGPVDMLEDALIPVKVPLSTVGQNLGEHPAILLTPFLVNDTSLFTRIYPEDTEKLIKEYNEEDGGGILGDVHEGGQCFIVSSKAHEGWPDIWIPMNPIVTIGDKRDEITFYVVLGRPQSRGTLGLNTTAFNLGIRDDQQLALIDFKFLTHPDDIEVMLEGIKFVFQIAEETEAFKGLGMKYAGEPDTECEVHEFRTDEYWRCVLSQRTLPWIHMVGTCGMGPDSGNSVTDSKFRVRGVDGLRVVDASVIPAVPNANTNAPIMMIAEKAADEIFKTWEDSRITTTTSTSTSTTTTTTTTASPSPTTPATTPPATTTSTTTTQNENNGSSDGLGLNSVILLISLLSAFEFSNLFCYFSTCFHRA